jgi:hypothetical protein
MTKKERQELLEALAALERHERLLRRLVPRGVEALTAVKYGILRATHPEIPNDGADLPADGF